MIQKRLQNLYNTKYSLKSVWYKNCSKICMIQNLYDTASPSETIHNCIITASRRVAIKRRKESSFVVFFILYVARLYCLCAFYIIRTSAVTLRRVFTSQHDSQTPVFFQHQVCACHTETWKHIPLFQSNVYNIEILTNVVSYKNRIIQYFADFVNQMLCFFVLYVAWLKLWDVFSRPRMTAAHLVSFKFKCAHVTVRRENTSHNFKRVMWGHNFVDFRQSML